MLVTASGVGVKRLGVDCVFADARHAGVQGARVAIIAFGQMQAGARLGARLAWEDTGAARAGLKCARVVICAVRWLLAAGQPVRCVLAGVAGARIRRTWVVVQALLVGDAAAGVGQVPALKIGAEILCARVPIVTGRDLGATLGRARWRFGFERVAAGAVVLAAA